MNEAAAPSAEAPSALRKAEQMFDTMLELQDRINCVPNPEWRTMDLEWYRAVWVECAELLGHVGWKWWKQQTPDIEQAKLELVDIWHFGLSDHMLMSGERQRAERYVFLASLGFVGGWEQGPRPEMRESVERLAQTSLDDKAFSMIPFAEAMRSFGLDFDELFKLYVAKNALNHFRQDNGYKDGSYVKVWNGREDNEHLTEIVEEVMGDAGLAPEESFGAVIERLNERYTEHTGGKSPGKRRALKPC